MQPQMSGKTWQRKTLLLCLLSALAGTASAQTSMRDLPWGNYIGTSLGVPDFGNVGLKIFGGQQLHRYFGWEAALTRFGSETEATPFGDVSTDFWGISGAAVGILPISNQFSGFAKLGLMAGRKRVHGPAGDTNDNDLNFLLGIGARFALTPSVAIRAEYEDFNQGNLISVGVSYRF